METNEINVDDPIKKEKKDKGKFKGVSSYKCQFCEKSFPRLGYLKKHEQVSEFVDCPLISFNSLRDMEHNHKFMFTRGSRRNMSIKSFFFIMIMPFIIMTHGL